MPTRRRFLRLGALGSFAVPSFLSPSLRRWRPKVDDPIIVSTWRHGLAANEEAWRVSEKGGTALDMVERGVRVTEDDPDVATVGYGGRPDREGNVTLDASIMDGSGRCGAVAALRGIRHPISVARLVMERTPHVMLVGQGALAFALENGFEEEDLLTSERDREWREWLESGGETGRARINIENHDTIGMLAVDASGRIAGACTTSGAAWKLPGRVGDSPIIGAGLFVDAEVGGACATGWGEAVIAVAGSHLVVELMRHGHDPEDACRIAAERVTRKNREVDDIQVGFLALRRDGALGAFSIQSGFDFAVKDRHGARLIPSRSL